MGVRWQAGEGEIVWPDPVPCRPENPVQGIRTCEALRTGQPCPWLRVRYCGVRADDMASSLETLELEEFAWLFEDDVDADDLQEAADELQRELRALDTASSQEYQALGRVRWLVRLIGQSERYGFGLSGRFAERLDTKDRY